MAGVYIPGMEMPIFCNYCVFSHNGVCDLNHDVICTYEPVTRAADCPLVHVPDHGRLGDLDALKKKTYPFPCAIGVEYAVTLRAINEAPTIIPAEEEKG